MSRAIEIKSELQDVAQRMREREEQILSTKAHVENGMGEVASLAIEQGSDITLVRSKLGKVMTLEDWLHAHVPQLDTGRAAKYERISREGIRDTRQLGLLLWPTQQDSNECQDHKPAKVTPWEHACEWLGRLNKLEFDGWNEDQMDLMRQHANKLIERLGGKAVW